MKKLTRGKHEFGTSVARTADHMHVSKKGFLLTKLTELAQHISMICRSQKMQLHTKYRNHNCVSFYKWSGFPTLTLSLPSWSTSLAIDMDHLAVFEKHVIRNTAISARRSHTERSGSSEVMAHKTLEVMANAPQDQFHRAGTFLTLV